MAQTLDQILRELPPQGEVQFTLAHFPLDEILLTLHETRFTGSFLVGQPEEADSVYLKEGKVIDVLPTRYLHVQQLARTLLEIEVVGGKALRSVIEADANLDGLELGRRLLEKQLISLADLEQAWLEQARRRLFYLYDHVDCPVVVREGVEYPESFAPAHAAIDILPAVAYGIVVRSTQARRKAMLAFAAHKHAQLVTGYDEERNRCGLPPPLLEATRILSRGGARLGSVPVLPGLTPQTTAGLLLLFQRISLLRLDESISGDIPSLPPESRHSLDSL